MRALDLDYQRSIRGIGLGIVLLAAGLALAAVVGIHYWDLRQEASRWAAKVATAERLARQGQPRTRQAPRDEAQIARQAKAANAVLQQLAVPWEVLFGAIESSKGKQVALLALDPDAKKGVVRINGEAKGLDQVVRYLKRLQGQAALGDVVLVEHHVQQREPRKPVRFSITAAWVRRP